MFTLIAIGPAWHTDSAFDVVSPNCFPLRFAAAWGSPVYFEAAAVITALVLLGQVLEMRAEAGPAAPSERFEPGAEKRACDQPDGRENDMPMDRFVPGHGCVFARERKSPPTAWWRRGPARSMKRW